MPGAPSSVLVTLVASVLCTFLSGSNMVILVQSIIRGTAPPLPEDTDVAGRSLAHSAGAINVTDFNRSDRQIV